NDVQHLIDFVYPDILTAKPTVFADKGILSPTNDSTDEIDGHIQNLLSAETNIMSTCGNLIKANPDDIAEATSPELLQSIDVTGVPSHHLALKVCRMVMFVCNVIFACGIVKGRECVVCALSPRIVDFKMIADGMPLVKIPRITFEFKIGRRGLTFHRQQFQLGVCYAMAINMSRGQTLERVGLDLRSDVFCDGQLFVALSRSTSSVNVMCVV
ncbi:unnamed protein product, partial [Hapterophycus canaliculatus]